MASVQMAVRFVPAIVQAPQQYQEAALAGKVQGGSTVWHSPGVLRSTRRVLLSSPRPLQQHVQAQPKPQWRYPHAAGVAALASAEAQEIHSPRLSMSQARSPSPPVPNQWLRPARPSAAAAGPPPRTLGGAGRAPAKELRGGLRPKSDLDCSTRSLYRAAENAENVPPPSANLMHTLPALKLVGVSRPPPQAGAPLRGRRPRASLPAQLDAEEPAPRDATPQPRGQRPLQMVSMVRDLSATTGRQAPAGKPLQLSVLRARRATLPTSHPSPDVPSPRALQSPAPPPPVAAPQPAVLPGAWLDMFEALHDGGPLGGGAFAEVFRVRHRLTSRHYAVKVMHRPNFAMRGIERQIDLEVGAMLAAAAREDADPDPEGHHVLRLLDVAEDGEHVFLLMELCEDGDLLRRLLLEARQRFSETSAATWTRQLFLGLRTVHSLGFLHRDIKPDNLLCGEGGRLKIGDFGWCCIAGEAPTSLAGTFQYMAPEVLLNQPQTEQVDVWSAGVTLYQMLLGRPLLNTYLGPGATQCSDCDPHRATAVKQRWLVEEIYATCPPPREARPEEVTPLCWDFLRRALAPDCSQRITVEAALEHPWLATAPHAL